MKMIARLCFTHRERLLLYHGNHISSPSPVLHVKISKAGWKIRISILRALLKLTGKEVWRKNRKFFIRKTPIIIPISQYTTGVFRISFANWRFCLQDYQIFSRSPSSSQLSDDVFSVVEEWRFGGQIGRREQWEIVIFYRNTDFFSGDTLDLSEDGFITSPGYNGCPKLNSGGFQNARSPLYQKSAEFNITSD